MVKLLDLGLMIILILRSDFQCYRITPLRTQSAQRSCHPALRDASHTLRVCLPHYLFIIAPKGGNFNE